VRPLKAFGLLLLLVLLVRSTVLAWLALHGVWLDVGAMATVLWALRQGVAWGSTFGFLLGLALDLDAGGWLGRHALALAVLGHGVGLLSGTLVRDSWRTQFALLLIATLLHQLLALAIQLMGSQTQWSYWAPRVALAAATTSAAGVGLLALVRQLRGRPLYNDVPFDSRADQ
jgi:rod shape-determining protein MreD